MNEERRVAIVTGATRGIGRATALRLAEDGYTVVVNYRGGSELADDLCQEIQTSGGEALAIQADVTDADQVGTLIEQTINQAGRVDALINNAGITRDKLIMRMSDEDWDAVITTNLRGAFLCSRAVTRPMMRQRSGTIVNLTSVVGLVGNVGQANYSAAKAGLVGLTKTMARELGPRNITVNAVAPGFIDTRLTDILPDNVKDWALGLISLGRFGEAEDVANAVSFLASPQSRYITGVVLSVDGGMFMAT